MSNGYCPQEESLDCCRELNIDHERAEAQAVKYEAEGMSSLVAWEAVNTNLYYHEQPEPVRCGNCFDPIGCGAGSCSCGLHEWNLLPEWGKMQECFYQIKLDTTRMMEAFADLMKVFESTSNFAREMIHPSRQDNDNALQEM